LIDPLEYVLSPASAGLFSCAPTEQADQRAHAVGAHVAEGHGVWAGWVCVAEPRRAGSLLVRTSPLQSERSLVSEREPVQEEHATVQDEGWQSAGAWQ